MTINSYVANHQNNSHKHAMKYLDPVFTNDIYRQNMENIFIANTSNKKMHKWVNVTIYMHKHNDIK